MKEQLDKIAPLLRGRTGTPLTAAALGFDPYDALLRLSMDQQNSRGALRALGQLSDPRVGPTLLDLSDNELFSTHGSELTDVLALQPATPDGIARTLKKLDSTDPIKRENALTLLIAWHADSAAARIADEVLLKSAGPYDVIGKLAEWNNPTVMNKARSLLSAPKAEGDARARAIRLLVAAKQPQDIRVMLQAAQDSKTGGDHSVLPVLVGMVLDGSVEAMQGVAGFISSKDLPLRRATLKALAEAMVKMSASENEGGNNKVPDLPVGIAAAVRGVLTVPNKEALPDVLTILILTGDTNCLNLILPEKPAAANPGPAPGPTPNLARNPALGRAAVAAPLAAGTTFTNPDEELLSSLVSAITRLRTPKARPFALALIRAGKLSVSDFNYLHGWLRQYSGMSKNDVEDIRNEWLKVKDTEAEAALGRAGDGLTITVALNTTQLGFDRKEHKEYIFPATVQNTCKWPLKFNEEALIRVHWRSPSNPDSNNTVSDAMLYLGKAKPPTIKAAFRSLNEIELVPGKSATGTLVIVPPTSTPGPIPHQVSFQWQWHASTGSDAKSAVRTQMNGTYGTKWVELSLIPDLWIAVDERNQRAK